MLYRALMGRTESRSSTFVLPGRDLFPQPLSGPLTVSEATSLSIPAAYRCVQIIADSGSSLDLDAYRAGDRLERRPRLLEQPNPAETRIETVGAMLTSLLIHGNVFVHVTSRDDLGWPTSVVVLAPDAVSVDTVAGLTRYRVGGHVVDEGDIGHVKGLTLPGHALGLGPLGLQRRTLGLAIAGEEYAGEMYVSGAVPSGVLSAEHELTSEEAEDLKHRFVAAHGGRNRSPAVLSGAVTYQALGFSSADLELVASRSFSAQQICTVFGVPGFLVGVETGSSKTYSSVAQDSALFHRYTLKPWLARLEALFTAMLPRGQEARFDLDGLLSASTAERYAAWETGIRAGFLTVDEARRREGLEQLAEEVAL